MKRPYCMEYEGKKNTIPGGSDGQPCLPDPGLLDGADGHVELIFRSEMSVKKDDRPRSTSFSI